MMDLNKAKQQGVASTLTIHPHQPVHASSASNLHHRKDSESNDAALVGARGGGAVTPMQVEHMSSTATKGRAWQVVISMDKSSHSVHMLKWCLSTIISPHDTLNLLTAVLGATDQNEKHKEAVDMLKDRANLCQVPVTLVTNLHAVPCEEPGKGIVQHAIDTNPDLLVVGSRGLGTVRRAILGSVSDYCVHHSPSPVLVIKESYDPSHPVPPSHKNHFVIPVDHSSYSRDAFNWLVQNFMKPPEFKNTVMTVIHVSKKAPNHDGGKGQKLLAQYAALCIALGLEDRHAIKRVHNASKGKAVLQFANESRADMIVVASLTKNGKSTVSDFLLHNAKCGVLIYHSLAQTQHRRASGSKGGTWRHPHVLSRKNSHSLTRTVSVSLTEAEQIAIRQRSETLGHNSLGHSTTDVRKDSTSGKDMAHMTRSGSTGVLESAIATKSLGANPQPDEINKIFETFMEEKQFKPEVRAVMRALPAAKKWTMLVQDSQLATSHGSSTPKEGVTPAYWAGLFAKPTVVATDLHRFRAVLRSEGKSWLGEFFSKRGLSNLANVLARPLSDDVKYEVLQSIKYIMDARIGLEEMINNPACVEYVMNLLIGGVHKLCEAAIKLLTVLAYISEEGHDEVLSALQKAFPAGRFKYLIQTLIHGTNVPYKLDVLTFINTLINGEHELEKRVILRSEMIELGLFVGVCEWRLHSLFVLGRSS